MMWRGSRRGPLGALVHVVMCIVLLLSACGVVADVPSHCLKWDVVGTWDFKMSSLQKGSPECSRTRPDDIVTVYKLGVGYDKPGFDVKLTGNFTLNSNFTDEATLCIDGSHCETAKWTMVYDEAMSIKGTESGLMLLFHFAYVPRDPQGGIPSGREASKWKSLCDRTFPGWYGFAKEERGCVVAKNRQESVPRVSVSIWDNDDDAPVSFLSLRTTLRHKLRQSQRASLLQSPALDPETIEEKVALINKRQKSWVADASAAHFAKDYALEDALRSAGGVKQSLLKPKSYSLDVISDPELRRREEHRRKCVRSVLPQSLDWSNNPLTRTPVINQGACGSCYAVASVDAYTSRLRLKKNDPSMPARSYENVVMCSVTNQGCDGGFPWLIGHHAFFDGVVSEVCKDSCGKCNDTEHAKSWGYVGGYYGKGNPEDMLWSLNRDGPLVVAINAAEDLMVYRSGLFFSEEPKPSEVKRTENAFWVATTHAVTLVGYGVMEVEGRQVETWRLKNSWGKQWGENGYFNIQRGADAMAVESMAVHAIFGDGKPGNPDFEESVRARLRELQQSGDNSCDEIIEDMLRKELV